MSLGIPRVAADVRFDSSRILQVCIHLIIIRVPVYLRLQL